MAREFPRFLYSDPKNTKSPGPFIVHTLPPRKLFRVVWDDSKTGFSLTDLSEFSDSCTIGDSIDIMKAAEFWLSSQIKSGAIINPLFSEVIDSPLSIYISNLKQGYGPPFYDNRKSLITIAVELRLSPEKLNTYLKKNLNQSDLFEIIRMRV